MCALKVDDLLKIMSETEFSPCLEMKVPLKYMMLECCMLQVSVMASKTRAQPAQLSWGFNWSVSTD